MKKYGTVLALVSLFLVGCILTGFQCGSTEMTSAKLYLAHPEVPGNVEKAEAALEKEVAKNPANAEAWFDLGMARYQLRKYEPMLDAFDNSLKASNEYQKNINDYKANAWAQAFNAGVSIQNKMANASADSQAILGKQAADQYLLALKMNPDSASTYQNLAALYHNMKNYDQEIVTWENARKRKNDPAFTNYIINALIKRSEDERAKNNKAAADDYMNKAITELEAARKADPNNPELLSMMINLYIEAGRASEAMSYIKESVEKDPSNKINQNNLGLLLLQTDKLEEAITHFDAALAVDSVFEDALRNASVAYVKLGQKIKDQSQDKTGKSKTGGKAYTDMFKHAVVYLERLVRLKPDNADFWDALGTAYGNAGMFKDAERAVKKADSLRKP